MAIPIKVKRVLQAYDERRVNQLIPLGWLLVEVLQFRDGDQASALYILAWEDGKGDPQIPQHPDDLKIRRL